MKHKLIKKVLMCEPTYFDTLDYSINPWMQPGTIDGDKAMLEWKDLIKAYKSQDIEVEVIKQQEGVPDMVFATDQGIVLGKTIILSRFWCDERKGETQHYRQWFTERGYTIKDLPENTYFEGNGDSYFWHDKLLIGVGYRADKKTCRAISKIFDIEVVPLQIVDPAFYHLDVGFLPLNNETAFYYPKAFSEESRGLLKKLVPNLLEFTEEEANGFAANSVVTDHHVVHQSGNSSFKKKIEDLGYTSIEVNLDEFRKSGGGAHCLTNVLEEGWEN
jgi:N-dimethylarginine dimethylaminohydrolase